MKRFGKKSVVIPFYDFWLVFDYTMGYPKILVLDEGGWEVMYQASLTDDQTRRIRSALKGKFDA